MFASEFIPENTVYGPYEGVIVNPRNLVKADKLRVGGYAWEVSWYLILVFYNKILLCF